MPWQSLSTTLTTKPRVLAGPLLRKVTPREVTVWLVLRKPGYVTLKVLAAAGNDGLMEGKRHTVAVGTNLHIVAVTAKPPTSVADLAEGNIYRYDLLFDFDDRLSQTLATATDNAALAYPPFDKPSFCLPPADINKLRLFHGSCRIPHGNGADALPLLDGLINQAADNPYARPHQLLLTGDQIYADDVGFAMSMMLTDASEALLGWTEEFICNMPDSGSRRKVTELNPGLRSHLVVNDAGFTSVDTHGQLIGLGEYLAMYLFVWSDTPWPAAPATLPTFAEIEAYFSGRFGSIDNEVAHGELFYLSEADRDSIDSQTARTSDFRNTLKDVRRALANIPSYMIFDDHDVTDDWNLTRNICRSVYGSELGLRIVQNALLAYALCQHWGNAPGQFGGSAKLTPGEKLMLLVDGTDAANYDGSSAAIRTLLGLHDEAILAGRPDNGLFHDAGALIYNYAVEAPGHQIIVTDTRSWRSYPRGGSEGADFLPDAQLLSQIVNVQPATGNRALLLVLSTNAPATQPVRTTSRYPSLTRKLAWLDDRDRSPDMYEAWEMPRNATDRLYKAITDRLPLVSGKRYGRAVLLSGDVHTSFASRLLFNGTTRFEDPQASPQPVSAVIAQLVSSSLRKQTGKTEGMHRDGYDYMPSAAEWSGLVPANKPEGYIGWNLASGVKKIVAKRKNNPGSGGSYTRFEAKGPKTLSMWNTPHGVTAQIPPDYSYRLDYLFAVLQASLPSVPPAIPPVPAGASAEDRKRAAEAYHKASGSYRKFNAANATRQEIVGVNNIAEITFDWGAGDSKFALHTPRWLDWKTSSVMFTTYVVSLNPNDPTFPELKPLPPTP